MMLNKTDTFLLELLKASYQDIPLSMEVSEEDLSSVVKTAEEQGVVGLVFDTLSKLPKEKIYYSKAYHKAMSAFMKMEEKYPTYHKAIEELGAFFHENNLQMLLFKGEDMRRNWIKPELRPTGDVDIFLWYKKDVDLNSNYTLPYEGKVGVGSVLGDCLLRDKLHIPVTKSKLGHHSHIRFQGQSVENHYEFSNTYFGGKRIRKLEKCLRELACGDASLNTNYHKCTTNYHELDKEPLINTNLHESNTNHSLPFEGKAGIGSAFYSFPSSDFNAVFLMWHLSTHFCGEAVSLRQLYDWLMFLRVHHSEIEWTKVEKAWEDAGMKPFAQGINGLLIKYLGADKAWFLEFTMDEVLSDRILNDILHGPRRDASGISNVLHYFKSNWKYNICTGHSWVRPTLSSAWMHLVHREDLEEKEV